MANEWIVLYKGLEDSLDRFDFDSLCKSLYGKECTIRADFCGSYGNFLGYNRAKKTFVTDHGEYEEIIVPYKCVDPRPLLNANIPVQWVEEWRANGLVFNIKNDIVYIIAEDERQGLPLKINQIMIKRDWLEFHDMLWGEHE